MNQNLTDQIRQRAYDIWQREGRPVGREVDHWLNAAAELEAESTRDTGATQGTAMRGRKSPTAAKAAKR